MEQRMGARPQEERKALTVTAISNAKSRPSAYRLFDTKVQGFHVVITPAGSKTYFLQFKSPETGKRRFMRIGGVDALDLKEARDLAREERKLLDRKKDPIEEKERINQKEEAAQSLLEAEAAAGTVAQLSKLYVEDLKEDKKRSWQAVENIYKNDIKEPIGDFKVKDVTPTDIVQIVSKIQKRGSKVMAGHTQRYLKTAFDLAIKAPYYARWEDRAPDFGIQFNPVTPLPAAATSGTIDRVLSHDEIKRIWSEAGTVAMKKDMAIAIKLLICTGQRVEEVLQAEWKEFDLEKKVWALPAKRRKGYWKSESEEPHLVPLTDLSVELLEELQGMARRKRYLFPGKPIRVPGKRPKIVPRKSDALQQAVSRFCKPIGKSKRKPMDMFTPRDCRRTFKTTTGEIGLSQDIRDRIQGHSKSDVSTRNYDRWGYWPQKQEAMEQYNAWLSDLVHKNKDNVVKLRAS